jgi:prolyl 4-hydroxylase
MTMTMTMTRLRRPLLLLPVLAIVLQAPTPCRAGYWAGETEKDGAEPPKFVKQSEEVPVEYGVDVSFPIHHKTASVNYPWLQHNVDSTAPTPHQYRDMVIQPLGDKQAFYNEFVDSCVKHFGKKGKRCLQTESDRVEMALRQPQSMQNYTAAGFKKIKAPESIFKLIKEFWDKNKDSDKPEQWGVGNTYT